MGVDSGGGYKTTRSSTSKSLQADPAFNRWRADQPAPKPATTQAFRQADQAATEQARATPTAFRQAEQKANPFSGVQAAASAQPANQPVYGTATWLQQTAARFADQLTGRNQPQQSKGVFGVDYGPNWTRSNYNPADSIDPSTGQPYGQAWRQTLGDMLMTPDEYLRRRQSWNEQFQPGYMDWQNRAYQAASTLAPAQYNQWKAANPQPSGFLQTQQEWINRNNATPTGYTYVPFGSGYIKKPTLTSANNSGAGSGSGYGGYGRGYGGYGGGGGGYGDGYGSGNSANDFYNRLLSWKVLEVQGG